MADDVQRQVKRYAWVNPSGSAIGPAGITADELKVHQGAKAGGNVAIQPQAQRAPVEFIAPTTSSENLRLAVPVAANPFATPLGPRHNHIMLRRALARQNTEVRRALMGLLKTPPPGIKEEDAARMNKFIEERIREAPEQCFFVHKRFKTRPPGEASIY